MPNARSRPRIAIKQDHPPNTRLPARCRQTPECRQETRGWHELRASPHRLSCDKPGRGPCTTPAPMKLLVASFTVPCLRKTTVLCSESETRKSRSRQESLWEGCSSIASVPRVAGRSGYSESRCAGRAGWNHCSRRRRRLGRAQRQCGPCGGGRHRENRPASPQPVLRWEALALRRGQSSRSWTQLGLDCHGPGSQADRMGRFCGDLQNLGADGATGSESLTRVLELWGVEACRT